MAPSWFPPLLHVVPHVSLDAAGRAMGTSGTGGNEAETEHVAADVWMTCGIARNSAWVFGTMRPKTLIEKNTKIPFSFFLSTGTRL